MNSQNELPAAAYIKLKDVPVVHHLSKIRCGSYTTEWIARAIGLHPIPANDLLHGPIWFDMFRPIVPSDMMKLFRFRGMECEEVDLNAFTDDQRLEWVKRQVAVIRKPPAILIKTKILHWIAVGGYDDKAKVFFIYDSRYGNSSIDPAFPIGNNSIPYDTFLKVWKGRWWLKYKAIVITTTVKNPQLIPELHINNANVEYPQ